MKTITETTNDIQNEWLENYPYDEIEVGDTAFINRCLLLRSVSSSSTS